MHDGFRPKWQSHCHTFRQLNIPFSINTSVAQAHSLLHEPPGPATLTGLERRRKIMYTQLSRSHRRHVNSFPRDAPAAKRRTARTLTHEVFGKAPSQANARRSDVNYWWPFASVADLISISYKALFSRIASSGV